MESRHTVLVVDDDRAIRTLLADTLRLTGYSVVTAENGEEALRIADEHQVDLVMTDYLMPGIDGRELARRLRLKIAVPIVLVSGSPEAHGNTDTQGGIDAFISKPFAPRSLLETVEGLLTAQRV